MKRKREKLTPQRYKELKDCEDLQDIDIAKKFKVSKAYVSKIKKQAFLIKEPVLTNDEKINSVLINQFLIHTLKKKTWKNESAQVELAIYLMKLGFDMNKLKQEVEA